ncbi:PepSY-associated TM helix domain-containing protein [Burkholderia plantarii]|uniref:PepSY-associated TM helix domain protein n=1 Tax=Burkholderia plantarii TaxID=41899 RepID=A0A0B6RZP5_BURPL|nr:PepSY-associated TM helix domain-containing protein [Burkholderia plantarii]AJK46560.1 hypothetical protein, transmembrane [Burkholderia plantarii]
MPVPLRDRWRDVHRGAGLLAGVVLFVILFSGTWSLAQESMAGWWRRAALSDSAGVPPLNRLIGTASAQGFDLRDARITLPRPADPAVRFRAAHEPRSLVLDPATGQAAATGAVRGQWLVTLHKTLFAGFPGRIVVSLWGIVLLLLVIAGIVVHRRRWPGAARIRYDRGRHLLLFDLHAFVGLWSLPWLVLFGFTGAFSGLGALGIVALASAAYPGHPKQAFAELTGPPPPAAMQVVWQHPPDVESILRLDARRSPGFRPEIVTLHHWGDAAASVEIAGITSGLASTALFERHLYRAADGFPLARRTVRGRGFWLRAFVAMQPLHFARYGWVPRIAGELRALHFLTAIGACGLCVSGLYLRARRRQGRSGGWRARGLAASVTGVCGGLVLAAGLSLLAGRLLPAGARDDAFLQRLPWYLWGGSVACAWLAPRRLPVGRCLSAAAGAAYLLAGLLHLFITVRDTGHPYFWNVDAVLAGGGGLLLALAIWPPGDAPVRAAGR